ncbi:MAG TPA: alpha/beta fold hydrolase [Candidatus Eisenbacteria bacterium]|nr:alpha/beta fold hydrolase [Candidatus Eisenbacteria bacterium]
MMRRVALVLVCLAVCAAPAHATDGDYVIKDFRFRTGEALPELRIHYLTLGQPVRDARGQVSNAVLILHGTGGTGRQFMSQQFASELFGVGALLDTTRTYVILPDGIGHGRSSKPSDGLHMRFPRYDYDDMVAAQHRLLTEHLGVRHLRLLMGTSMGCMHAWVWLETYPDFADAAMPLACQPVALVGRNRLWRSMLVDAIKSDPEWKDGEYTTQPRAGLRTAVDLLVLAGSAPLYMQKALAARDSVDRYLQSQLGTRMAALDANDLIYQVEASRTYDPSPGLEKVQAPVLFVNSADDFINPPELGIAEREIQRVKRGRFVLLPITDATRGHGTHTWAKVWKSELERLLRETAK